MNFAVFCMFCRYGLWTIGDTDKWDCLVVYEQYSNQFCAHPRDTQYEIIVLLLSFPPCPSLSHKIHHLHLPTLLYHNPQQLSPGHPIVHSPNRIQLDHPSLPQ